MAAKSRKPRPNRKALALSDERSDNIPEANRTVGYARAGQPAWQSRRASCEQPALRRCSANRPAASDSAQYNRSTASNR